MNEFQFCYWLMGIFELGQPKELNSKQLLLVKEHLKLVTSRQHTFCNWLQGVLDVNEQDTISAPKLEIIHQKLRQEFANVIDKSYPPELWKPLQAAHDGKKYTKPPEPKKSQFVAMC